MIKKRMFSVLVILAGIFWSTSCVFVNVNKVSLGSYVIAAISGVWAIVILNLSLRKGKKTY